jgi:penicillin-binding protein 2
VIGPPEERRPPLTPQLALRVALVGSVALGMFAIIFFRLWFLQVLSGDQYVKAATVNRVRSIAVAAPRGEIVDRSGTPLVDSTKALAVKISPPDLPVPVTDVPSELAHPAKRDAVVYNRLARVLGLPTGRRHCVILPAVKAAPAAHGLPAVKAARAVTARLSLVGCEVAKQVILLPYADVTIKNQVSKDVQAYLAERQSDFPAVAVQRIYVTHYPQGSLAAQVLGTVGPIDQAELKQKAYKGISQNSIIGQTGLENYYDRYLRGTDGAEKVQVNALGQPTGELSGRNPVAGHNLALSLDAKVQRIGETALQQSIDSNPPSNGGAFVAMDPQDGEVYAMGSLPTFKPSIFTKTLSKAAYAKVTNPSTNFPLLNRAIDSAGPTGSTFKPITATAAMESGLWTPDESYDDTGKFCIGSGLAQQCRQNAGGASNGPLTLADAIKVSSDTFFYNLGAKTNADPSLHPRGGPLQDWARKYGIGQKTGIDLPGELSGTLPSPRWRAGRDKEEVQCEQAKGPFKGHPKHATCGIADGRPWSIGDNVSLAVGQGDVQVTPLQLAVVYSALANDGTIVRPHLGLDVENQQGTVLQKIDPPPSRHIPINPIYRQTILDGLRAAASQPGGTSADVFANFPEQVYGKTGTAQYNGQQDYSWYACFVPASATSKPIVVIVTVQQGGFGAVAAAPVARQILSQWFFGTPGKYVAGSSKTL